MNREMQRRLRRLEEAGQHAAGPLMVLSARPLPEDPDERQTFVAEHGKRRGRVVFIPARPMTVQEWELEFCHDGTRH